MEPFLLEKYYLLLTRRITKSNEPNSINSQALKLPRATLLAELLEDCAAAEELATACELTATAEELATGADELAGAELEDTATDEELAGAELEATGAEALVTNTALIVALSMVEVSLILSAPSVTCTTYGPGFHKTS